MKACLSETRAVDIGGRWAHRFEGLLYTQRMALEILDSTLRDGALAGDVNLSVEDKLRIAPLIDALGVTYLEGGWASVFPSQNW